MEGIKFKNLNKDNSKIRLKQTCINVGKYHGDVGCIMWIKVDIPLTCQRDIFCS